MAPLLEPLGLNERDEEVYRSLLLQPGSSFTELTAGRAGSRLDVEKSLSRLEQLGLVSRAPGHVRKYVPTPPDVALEALILRREQELSQQLRSLDGMRRSTAELVGDYRAGAGRVGQAHLVEIIDGREAIVQRYFQLEQLMRSEMRTLVKPPFAMSLDEINPVQLDRLQAGARYRTIYDRSSLEIPGLMDEMQTYARAGEQVRVLANLPMKLQIVDTALALLPLRMDAADADQRAIVVHPCALLEALVEMFELLWNRAVPLDFRGQPEGLETESEMSNDDLRLLRLVAAGLKDRAVARELGIAVRTMSRRIHALMNHLGAENRVQVGIQAAKRQLI